MRSHVLLNVIVLLSLGLTPAISSAALLSRTVTQYNQNYRVEDPAMLPLQGKPATANTPATGPSLDGVKGEFEYNVTIDTAGWYELIVSWDSVNCRDYIGGKTGVFFPYTKYFIHNPGVGMTYLNATTPTSAVSALPEGQIKPGVVWLGTNPGGAPRVYGVRMENYNAGRTFPPITGFELKLLAPNFSNGLRVTAGDNGALIGRRFVGVGENLPVVVQAGGNNLSGSVTVEVWKSGPPEAPKSYVVPFSASPEPITTTVNLTVASPGDYELKYKVGGAYVDGGVNLPKLYFTAIDVAPVSAPTTSSIDTGAGALVTIDCFNVEPDNGGTGIASDNGSTKVTSPVGSYRESGQTGFSDCNFKSRQPAPGSYIDWASWFAYTLPVTLTKGQLYRLEVDYPDNADRSFLVELRQSGTQPYQVRGSGVDTGGPYIPTNQMRTHKIFFWAGASTEPARVVILNYQTGMKAAVSKIRLYQVSGELPWLLGNDPGAGRSFGHWFEEPFCFTTTYSDGSVQDSKTYALAIERWAKMLKYVGGDTMWVTSSVYGATLFPSADYLKSSIDPNTPDYFKMILLIARKYNLKVVAEFHPQESAEILNKFNNTSTPNIHLAMNKNGKIYSDDGVDSARSPVFNPVHPANRIWLADMLKQFVRRYRLETAFSGVSIRSMGWQNPGFNNFHSIDWGYDDYTASQFAAANGGIADPGSPASRFTEYNTGGNKVKWDQFRADQINSLYQTLVAALITDVNVKPVSNFTIYSPVLTTALPQPLAATPTLRPAPADAGMKDNSIAGFKYAYSIGYGRRRSEVANWDSDRMKLTERAELNAFGSSRTYFATANYAEDGRWTVPNSRIGLGDYTAPIVGETKDPWLSGHIVPSDRYNLERYALMMANGDATTIMNGGNNYFIDQDTTREFLREYRRIPSDPFSVSAGTKIDAQGLPDGFAAVREFKSGGFTKNFYVVNRTRLNRSVNVTFGGSVVVTRPSTGGTAIFSGNTTTIGLGPFEMKAYNVTGNGSITDVTGDE